MSGKLGYRTLWLCAGLVASIGCGDDSGTPPVAGSGGSAGAAGTTGGTGAAGGGAVSYTCPASLAAPAALHQAAAMALLPVGTPNGACSFSSCHDAASKKANLALLATTPLDLKTQTVGKTACEVPSMVLVAAGGGNTALDKSWLWQKLVAPADSGGVIAPKPEWGTMTGSCGQEGGESFGVRMPRSLTDTLLGADRLTAVRDWICGGAPGP